ncbi:hypothetical protein [Miltoncostaea marina]|uniref:hypothetical protein n=1 Tax=Miltoncostaea marina TaxID=2843215 RepID=UPI001C3E568B|nr:hypothetical protein [Miltoncostaea marina]
MCPPLRAAIALVVMLVACASALAQGDDADEVALAERYAPVVRLVEQEEECGHGEPYEPIDVDVLFGEDTVALRGAWGGGDLIEVAPAAADIERGRYGYNLDFPGNALAPGCDYERWGRRVAQGSPPTAYAHVATEPGHPGRIALQYWFFYVFNDWNNTHEGDWEMIQIVWDAADAAEALTEDPVEVGYSQHSGGERADWGDDKLELVDGTHPVVHPAAGSHANYFGSSLYIGSSAEEGVGCDDTSGDARELRPVIRTIPSDPSAARRQYPWIGFEGGWGERHTSFYNAPTGPNMKDQWTHPIAWTGEWRDRSLAFAGGGALGTSATDFFCGAVAWGSERFRQFNEDPAPVVGVLAVLAALAVWGLSRATWLPSAPLRVARRRAWGQVLAAAGRIYARRFAVFGGIGIVLLPITVGIGLLQTLVLRTSGALGVQTGEGAEGLLGFTVLAAGSIVTLLGFGLVQLVTVHALMDVDAGRHATPLRALRAAVPGLLPLCAALAIAVVVVTLLSASVILLPLAIWLAVRWSLIAPVIAAERVPPRVALARSSLLVRGDWLKVASLTIVGAAVALVVGPLAGALMIFFTDLPGTTANVVAGVVYALVIPFVALTTAYAYLDIRVGEELAGGPKERRGDLPAEIALEPPAA